MDKGFKLKIVCLNADDYLGRGGEYVNILYDSIKRNTSKTFEFICFTNTPEGINSEITLRPLMQNVSGWWHKLSLFKEFTNERIFYFDLDTVITGDLDNILSYDGEFAILRDFYRPQGFQSSVMSWKGDYSDIWDSYENAEFPNLAGGDQVWIEGKVKADLWQDLYPKEFASYKATPNLTGEEKIIIFHGEPRPHQVKGWVSDIWKINGNKIVELGIVGNTSEENLIKNIDYSTGLDREWLNHIPVHEGHAVIVGGGPSLKDDIEQIRLRQQHGQKIFTLNNSWKILAENGIKADFHVMLDAREENLEFIPPFHVEQYYASQCHPKIWDASPKAVLWNHINAMNITDKGEVFIAGGSTVGLNALSVAYILGYRNLHLYGFDSSYEDESHHAYNQSLNDGENTVTVSVNGKEFKCAAWMASQVADFTALLPQLLSLGCTLTVHGRGLLPYIANNGIPLTAADERAASVLDKISNIQNPIGVEVGVFTGELSKRLLTRPDLTLYMVDSWIEHHKDSEYAKTDYHGTLSKDYQASLKEHTAAITSFAGERAKIIQKDSVLAAKDFEDQSLDFVFLDADHNYEAVKGDIKAWMPKIKDGGWISGHDYANENFPSWGVKKAVDEIGIPELGLNYTWFINKGA